MTRIRFLVALFGFGALAKAQPCTADMHTDSQVLQALQRQLVGHPYLHAGAIYVCLLMIGVACGLMVGTIVERLRAWLKRRCNVAFWRDEEK